MANMLQQAAENFRRQQPWRAHDRPKDIVGGGHAGLMALLGAEFWIDATQSPLGGGKVKNLGTGGSALDATLGSTTGTDTNDPTLLVHSGTNYLYLPGVAGNMASVPDNAAFSPTTSLSYRFAVALQDWTPGAVTYLGGHYEGTGNQRSSLCGVNTPSGSLLMNLSSDGITPIGISSTALPAVTDGAFLAVRYDWLSAGPTVRFYTKATTLATAPADCASDAGWTQLGADVTASVPVTLFNPTSVMYVSGYSAASGSDVSSLATVVKVDGVTQVNADFTTGITSGGQTTFTEKSANAATVTINRATSGRKSMPVVRNVMLLGTDDYLEVADNALLNFTAGQSMTALVVARQWNTPVSAGRFLSKAGTGTIAGYHIASSGATFAPLGSVGDGVTAPSVAASAATAGALAALGFVADRTGQTILAFTNNSLSGTNSLAAVGSSSNASPMRIGATGTGVAGSFPDTEFVAAAVFRRALTASEIASIVAYYGAS